MEKHYLIYKITNKLNEMIYIGCHITNNKNDNYMGSGKFLKRAVEKYDIDNFTKEILFECSSKEEMLDKERDLVNENFIIRKDTYNITIGGYGGYYYVNENNLNHSVNQHLIVGKKLKEDEEYREWFRKKVSLGLKKYSELNPENPNGWVGKRHTKESKEKIGKANSIKQQGNGNSQYGTIWITNGDKNLKIKKNENIPDGWRKGRIIKKI